MSRLTRILAMTVGSVALFALFAVAGWAITDQFMADEKPASPLETVTLDEYHLIPAEADVEEQFARIDALQESVPPMEGEESVLGAAPDDPKTARVVLRSRVDVVDDSSPSGAGGSPGGEDSATSSTPASDTTEPPATPSDSGVDEPEDAPFLFGDLGLEDVTIAVPLDPIRFDVCAGSYAGAGVLPGCLGGIGGTIIAFEDDATEGLFAIVGSPRVRDGSDCGVSDTDIWRLNVVMSVPGTLNLTLWEGFDDSEPSATAFRGLFDVPAETAAEMTRSIDGGATGADRVPFSFCIEVPAMTSGVPIVAEHFVVSAYPDHGGARGPTYRDRWTAPDPRTDRPPTLIWPARDSLSVVYANVYRQAGQESWVKAVEIEPTDSAGGVCDTRGAPIRDRGPSPSGGDPETVIVGELVTTSDVGTSGGWPYNPSFSKADAFRAVLAPGHTYALCIYVTNSSSLDIAHSDATFVATPTLKQIAIVVDGVQGTEVAASADDVVFSIRPQIDGCRGYEIAYPGPNSHYFGPDQPICRVAADDVFAAGGFAVKVDSYTARTGDSWRGISESWIVVDESELVCDSACGFWSERVVRVPARDEMYNETRRDGIRIAKVYLEVRFAPPDVIGSSEWTIGTTDSYDATDSERSVDPVIYWESTGGLKVQDPVTGVWAASLSGTVRTDRFTTIDTAYIVTEGPLYGCHVDDFSSDLEQSSTVSAKTHSLEFSGLCFGQIYSLVIEATDAEGNSSVLTETVYAVAPDIILDASLQVRRGSPRSSNSAVDFIDFGPLEGVGLSAYNTPTVDPVHPALGGEKSETYWAPSEVPRMVYRICSRGTSAGEPFPRIWHVERSAQSSFSIETSVSTGTFIESRDVECEVIDRRRNGYESWGDTRVGATMTLKELFDGVVVESEGSEGTRLALTLEARWADGSG